MNPTVRDWKPIAASVEAVGLTETGRRFGLSKEAVRSGVRRFRAGQGGVAPENAPAGPGLVLNGTETRLVVPDRHGFAMSKEWWRIVLAVAREIRPKRVITMGDWSDMSSLSHHPKREPNITRFEDEIEEGKRRYGELQEAARPEEMDALEGNHEGWARSFMAEQPQLEGTLDVERRTHLREMGIRWVTLFEQDNFQIGPVAYCHGISESRHHAKATAEDFGPTIGCKHTVYGHMHTFQSYVSKAGYVARCCGFGGDEKNIAFGYKKGRPAGWRLGFLVQEISGNCVSDTEVHVVNGHAVFRGVVY